MKNYFHSCCVLGMVAIIFAMGLYLDRDDVGFQGIAGSREANVSFENSVEINAIHVLPGESVRRGQILLELGQTDLEIRRIQIDAAIQNLRAEIAIRDQMNRAVGNNSPVFLNRL